MMKTDVTGSSTYKTTLRHKPKDRVQLQDTSANSYSPAILTNSHSTDVNQIPRNLRAYVPIFGVCVCVWGGGEEKRKIGLA